MSKPRKYMVTAHCTISLHAVVTARSKKEAIAKAEELDLCAIHESTYDPDPEDGEWHTSSELDGTPFNIQAELDDK